ncbi:YdcF family protein [Oculatella sp. LEGE 06141]|uniref:YdcF family protein n=1 Tax=Oculatella sp. LEGE 06141 TaxID=1828648 RepID=UPI00188034D8|nr:YdcF family protein [Oculatella sp. LEGE 06141]MBE9181555.1 YdcF family protein [Oculatella sp. LEGE 06141]
MFELLTRIIIWIAIILLVRYILLQFIPRAWLTWLGGIVLVFLLLLSLLDPANRAIGIAWSVLSFPLRPLGLVIVLLASGLRAGVKKIDGNQVLAALIILLICSLPLTAYLLTAQTEQRSVIEAVNRAGTVEAARAIVVLGDISPANPEYRMRTQVNNATEGFGTPLASRLLYASELYREQANIGNEPYVIVSAGPQPDVAQDTNQTSTTETEAVTNLLVGMGVPRSNIIVDTDGIDVRSSAVAVRTRLNSLGFTGQERIILVSPTVSTRRALSTFANLNFQVIPRPTDFYAFQLEGGLQLAALTDLIPSVEALTVTTRVVEEYLASVYYFLRGWLLDPLGV